MRLSPRLRSAAVLLAAGLPLAARASAPMVKTQAPGFFRFMLGSFEVTALSDGTVKLPMTKLLKAPAAKTSDTLKKAFLGDVVETSDNAYLINTGAKLVLVDTGAGSLFGPTLGNVAANLKAAGYSPEQVDEIYITHAHPDHVGGLTVDGKPAFPNATLRLDQAELDFWLDDARAAAAPEDSKGFFQGAKAMLGPWVAAKKVKTFTEPTELVPGVKAQPAHGHTAGHTIYLVESDGQKLALLGDLLHAAAVQFPDPSVSIAFDTDSSAGAVERKQALAGASKSQSLIGITHVSFPGVGHVRAAGKAYEWLPINYTSLK